MRSVPQAKALIHFIPEENGQITDHFEVNPRKIRRISSGNGTLLPTYRYVIAISGANRAEAAHEFHDRVLAYPTDHGIFALYKTQEGTSALLLDINAVPSNGRAAKKMTKAEHDAILDLKQQLHGHRMIIVRGSFKNAKEFENALTAATTLRPHQYLSHIDFLQLQRTVNSHDFLSAASNIFSGAGKAAKKVPNVPGSRLVKRLGNLSTNIGDRLSHAANRAAKTPRVIER
ncbi:MAG: hypothetical protein U0R17_03070 [Acidimicrobiia bacterium]